MYCEVMFRDLLNPYSPFNGSTDIEQTPPAVISSPRLPDVAGLAAGLAVLPLPSRRSLAVLGSMPPPYAV